MEKELLKATKIVKKPGEPGEKYRARIVRAAHELEDAEWNNLSEETQEWVNAGVAALNAKETVADFPGAKVNKVEDKKADKPAAKKEPVKAPEKKMTKPEKKEPAKAASPEKAPDKSQKEYAPNKKNPGKLYELKKFIIKNPKASVLKVSEEMEKKGLGISEFSLTTVYYDIHKTMSIMRDLGILK